LSWVGPIAGSTARRVGCDADVTYVRIDEQGEATLLGREARFFSWAQRKAMIARDGDRCAVPFCDRPIAWADGHHLKDWALGGATIIGNGHCPALPEQGPAAQRLSKSCGVPLRQRQRCRARNEHYGHSEEPHGREMAGGHLDAARLAPLAPQQCGQRPPQQHERSDVRADEQREQARRPTTCRVGLDDEVGRKVVEQVAGDRSDTCHVQHWAQPVTLPGDRRDDSVATVTKHCFHDQGQAEHEQRESPGNQTETESGASSYREDHHESQGRHRHDNRRVAAEHDARY